jgi:hypothetical protein
MTAKQVQLRDMNGVELAKDTMAHVVMKKAIPLKVEFAMTDGTLETKEGPVRFEAGQAILTGTQGEQWPMPREKLEATYNLVDAEKGMWAKKPIEVLGKQIDEPFTVNVSWSNDPLAGKKGDWLVQFGKDDYGIVDKKIFEETYDVVRRNVVNAPVRH